MMEFLIISIASLVSCGSPSFDNGRQNPTPYVSADSYAGVGHSFVLFAVTLQTEATSFFGHSLTQTALSKSFKKRCRFSLQS